MYQPWFFSFFTSNFTSTTEGKSFLGDLPLRGSEGHRKLYLGHGQERHLLSPGHVGGAYGEDRLHRRTFTFVSRSKISRVYRKISENFDDFFASSHCLILNQRLLKEYAMHCNQFVNCKKKCRKKINMWHIPNKKRVCAHIFNVRALDAKQRINFFWPYLKLTQYCTRAQKLVGMECLHELF